jgi:hypothetical protein
MYTHQQRLFLPIVTIKSPIISRTTAPLSVDLLTVACFHVHVLHLFSLLNLFFSWGGGAEVFSASDTLKKDHGVFPDGSQLKGTYF